MSHIQIRSRTSLNTLDLAQRQASFGGYRALRTGSKDGCDKRSHHDGAENSGNIK